MSNGEDTDEDTEEAVESPDPADPSTFEERLDEAESAVEAAETEADLDEAEQLVDDIESELADAVFEVELGDEDEDEDDDSEEENPRDGFEDRISDLRDDIEEQRGPYLDEITDELESAESTITGSDWAEEGETEVRDAVGTFFETATETVEASFTLGAEAPEAVAEELTAAREEIGETGLHPDTDEETIETLLSGAETLTGDLDSATEFGDLAVREQLRREGFYDVLESENRKDFPPEWTAIKIYEKQGEVEPILSAMDKLDSDFMEANILDALEHIAPEAAFEDVHALAQRRNKQPVRILGRIGDDRACDTLHDFLGGGDVELEQTSLRALGAIGSEESTDPVAQRLLADNASVRSAAARALGRLGDTRAIDPLEDTLADDESDDVRASAAWALRQIGTERALSAAAAYTDDRSYVVQVEAERAAEHTRQVQNA